MAVTYTTGLIVGRFLSAVGDSPDDTDQEPELVPMSGTVTLTPAVSSVKIVEGAPEPVTVTMAPITAQLDAQGYLSRNGQRGVRVLASDGPVNPKDFTYTVTFSLSLGSGMAAVKFPQFPIQVLTGGVVDLTVVAPVSSSQGSPMVQGVGVQDVTVQNGELVFLLTNGAETRAVLPALSGEAAVNVSSDGQGGYTVNGETILGLTAEGTLPTPAVTQVEGIAQAAADSVSASLSPSITTAVASADEARETANAAVMSADTATAAAQEATTAATTATDAAGAVSQTVSSLSTQVSTLTTKIDSIQSTGTTVEYLGDGVYEIGA